MNEVVNITGLDYYGRGTTKINNIIVFVENALPGEIVKIKIIKKKKKYMEAIVTEYIKKNSDRCSFCKINCGSCHLNNISYNLQLEFKTKKVKEIIKKFTNDEVLIKNIIPNPTPTNYRNKATFHVKQEIGYYKNKTHDIIEVNNCLLVDNKINSILEYIKKSIILDNIYEIVIRASKKTNDSMVVFKISESIDENNIINKLSNIVTSIVIFDSNYKTIYGKEYIIDYINDLNFIISPDSFFQVNTLGVEQLYNVILKYINPTKDNNILDLYCGTGSISIYLSRFCKKVTGIEINKYAISDANKNKDLNKIKNVNFICGDVSYLVNDLKDKFDVIVVDPPRAGLDKLTITYLLKSMASKIVYVSCDPVTLARDLNILKNKYTIKEITPVDMFSYTYHVECVCLLNLR